MRFLLSCALLALFPSLAFAQADVVVNFRSSTTPPGITQVSPTNPLPVTAGGTPSVVTNALTVTASSAYTAGDSLGGLQTLSSVGSHGGYLHTVSIFSASGDTAEADAFVFNANPSASTCTDKTAFALAAADAGKLLPGSPIAITSSFAAGTPTVRVAQNLAIPFAATTLYVCYVTRGTPTFSATTDTSVQLGFVLN